MDWLATWRDFNILFSGLALILMLRWYFGYRHNWTFQEREVLRSLIVLLMACLVGSIWALVKDFDWNIGMIFTTLGTLHAIQAALRSPQRYVKPPEYDDGPADPPLGRHVAP